VEFVYPLTLASHDEARKLTLMRNRGHMRPVKIVATMLVVGVIACSCNQDEDAQALIGDLGRLDSAIVETLRSSPDETGLQTSFRTASDS